MLNIVSHESMLEKRRKQTVHEQLPYEVAGETKYIDKNMVNGEMDTLELEKPLGELITFGSVEELNGVLAKMTLDVDLGREDVPLLYQPIYDLVSNPNLPKILDAKWALFGDCVFLEHVEGQEVKFGSISAEKGPVARLQMFTTGFQFTEEMKLYNSTYEMEDYSKAVGRAHNALLNHLYLSPILKYAYKASNKTAKVTPKDPNAPDFMVYYETLQKALKDARIAKRPGSVLLASSANQEEIEQALKGGHTINGTVYPSFGGIQTIIYYDGYTVKVGDETYEYPGVAAGKAYLIRPKQGFKELVKAKLTTKSGSADISRLIDEQIVWYTVRGVFAALEENVQEISFS